MTTEIKKPAALKMDEKLFAAIAAALVKAGCDEDEVLESAGKLSAARIRTPEGFKAATDEDLRNAGVPQGDIIALRPLRAAGQGPAKKADPASLGDEELLTALNDSEEARKSDDFVGEVRKRFPFVFTRRVGDKATICVAELVSYLGQQKERPRARTWRGMAVTTVDRLIDRTRRVSPFNGDALVDGADPDGDAWELGDETMAFVRFARTRMSPGPQADKHMYLDALAEADGDYAKLRGNRWRRAIEEFDAAREEDPALVKGLLAELVKRDSVPPAARNVPAPKKEKPTFNPDVVRMVVIDERRKHVQGVNLVSGSFSPHELEAYMAYLKEQGFTGI